MTESPIVVLATYLRDRWDEDAGRAAAATPGIWVARDLGDTTFNSADGKGWWWVWREGVHHFAGVLAVDHKVDRDDCCHPIGCASITDQKQGDSEQADAEHIARWNPVAVLADTESKRALLDDLLAEPHDVSAWCTGIPCLCGRDDRVLRRLVLLCRPWMERDDFPTDALPEVAW